MFGLMCVSLLKHAVMANADVLMNLNIAIPVPFIYNVPLKPLSNFNNNIFNVTECDEWYMYSYASNATNEDRQYFGSNEGNNIYN